MWLARDEQTGLDVALKIIAREGKAAARAEREALATRRLRHERCVRAYDVGHDSSHVYIAYEYVPGRTLREALRAGDLADADAVEGAAQVLDALAHAHRTGIVHRDVKPSNVLLENGDAIAARLLDFGLAQFDGADTLTAVGDVPGTLAYISPERLAGLDGTPESDVWSVGVVLWEALAERHPFWGVPLQEVAQSIEAGAPPLSTERPDLPRRLLAAVDDALARDPADRPRASALAADLRRAVGTAPSHAPSEAADGRLVRVWARATVVECALPAALAGVTAALGATFLPFWPPVLVLAIVVAATTTAAFRPRVGLAVALAAPVFPFGNEAKSLAILYGAFALTWLALWWRDARHGLLFVTGPLLAPLGALALLPLALQPVHGTARRAAQGVVAVLAAVLVAGVTTHRLPVSGAPIASVGIAPLDTTAEAARAVWSSLLLHPVVLVGALVVGGTSALLPHTRSWRLGVAAVGAALTVGTIALGGGVTACLLVAFAWAVAGVRAARSGR